jgi:hypothetical protein
MADLNFLNLDNCEAVTFNTSTAGLQYIEYITGGAVKDFSNVSKYTITYSNNCCSPGISTDIRPLYQFTAEITACVSGPVFGVPSGTYTIEIGGINANLVQTFTVSANGGPSAAWPFGTSGGVLTTNLPQGDAVPSIDWLITITTTAGFVYILEFTITQVAVSCDGTIGALTITYPDLPSNIVEVPTINPEEELSLNELMGVDIINPGVYQVIFCETLYTGTATCIQNHVFIDCGSLKCQVVNKLVLCIDSNVMDYYNALTWANDCTDSVTYTELCALYEILYIILNSDGCYGKLDDCNCTDAPTIANKLYPVHYPTTTNNNPCTSC